MKRYSRLHIILIVCLLIPGLGEAQVFTEKKLSIFSSLDQTSGTAVADYDNDGDLDIFIVAYQSFDSANPASKSVLLENKGLGRLVDVTDEAGLGKQYSQDQLKDNKLAVAWGDYDNDGFPDLFLSHANSFQLLRNQGDKSFEDVTELSNLFPRRSAAYTGGLWWDYNNDGLLDIYVSNYDGANLLYRNLGDGTFESESVIKNVNDSGATWSSIAYDVNHDGWQDLYVINDYGLSRLYINQEGQVFEEGTIDHGLRNTGNGMGATIGDHNNDGHFDIYITNIADLLPNVLFNGNKECIYEENGEAMDVGQAGWAWGTQFFDADHDMDEDLYVVNGHLDLTYENRFFKNMHTDDGGSFIDWSVQSNTDGESNGMSTETFDYDNDGDLDILVSNTNDSPYLFENIGARGNWLKINLSGIESNRNAFGAKVRLSVDGKHLHRYHHGAGIMSQSVKPVHFGLSDNNMVDSLTIYWPNSASQTFYDINVNQTLDIIEQQQITTSTSDLESQTVSANRKFALISVSPNPSDEDVEIRLRTNSSARTKLEVFAVTGHRLFASTYRPTGANEMSIKLSKSELTDNKINAGIYLFRISQSEQSVTGKIVIE